MYSCISHANRCFTSTVLTQHISSREEQAEGLKAINNDSIPKANEKTLLQRRADAPAQVNVHTPTHITYPLTPCLAHFYISTQEEGRYKAAEDSPSSYVSNPLGPITVASGCFCFPVSAKQQSPGPVTYHNTTHFWANGRAVNKGSAPHHNPLIVSIVCFDLDLPLRCVSFSHKCLQ